MEALCQDLQREKSAMDEQFGQQRKKFMNIMVQKDTELSDVKKSVEQFSRECQQLRQQLKVKEEEILYMDKARKGMEYATREAFDADRIKYEEEIASLHRIIEQCSDHKREKEVVVKINESSEGRRSPSPGDPSLESDMAKAAGVAGAEGCSGSS
jgi:chromosome segregation ATPase